MSIDALGAVVLLLALIVVVALGVALALLLNKRR